MNFNISFLEVRLNWFPLTFMIYFYDSTQWVKLMNKWAVYFCKKIIENQPQAQNAFYLFLSKYCRVIEKVNLVQKSILTFEKVSQNHLGSVSPNSVHQAKSHRRTTFVEKIVIQFHQHLTLR